jgi:hypothetical protein
LRSLAPLEYHKHHKKLKQSVARYVLPQLKKLTAPLIAFFHALELDLSNHMEKAFGNKIRLLPKQLSDLNSATKYEGRIIIQEFLASCRKICEAPTKKTDGPFNCILSRS